MLTFDKKIRFGMAEALVHLLMKILEEVGLNEMRIRGAVQGRKGGNVDI